MESGSVKRTTGMKQKLFITAAAAALLLSSSLFATTAAARQITIPLRLDIGRCDRH